MDIMDKENITCKYTDEYYKKQEDLPIDCQCGCEETEEYDEYYAEYGRCEYKVRCKKCGTYLGSYAYGHWDY